MTGLAGGLGLLVVLAVLPALAARTRGVPPRAVAVVNLTTLVGYAFGWDQCQAPTWASMCRHTALTSLAHVRTAAALAAQSGAALPSPRTSERERDARGWHPTAATRDPPGHGPGAKATWRT